MMSPAVGLRIVASIDRNVDLPAPLGPNRPKISPLSILKDRSCSAVVLPYFCKFSYLNSNISHIHIFLSFPVRLTPAGFLPVCGHHAVDDLVTHLYNCMYKHYFTISDLF